MPPDSSLLIARFERDTTSNEVVLKSYQEEKSTHVQSNLSFENGTLKYKTKVVKDTVYLPAKDSIIYVPQEIPVEVNVLTWSQQTWIYLGKIMLSIAGVLLLLLIIRKLIKPRIL